MNLFNVGLLYEPLQFFKNVSFVLDVVVFVFCQLYTCLGPLTRLAHSSSHISQDVLGFFSDHLESPLGIGIYGIHPEGRGVYSYSC